MLTATSPTCATARGERRPPILRPEQREDQHRDREREQALAGLERVEAEHDLQVHAGSRRTSPSGRAAGPAASRAPRGAARSAAASRRGADPARGGARRSSHCANAPSSAEARRAPGTAPARSPSGVISVPLIVGGVRGLTNPHTLLRRIANTIRPRPLAESATPTMSSLRPPLGARRARDQPAEQQDDDHDDGLAGEHVAPRVLGRDPAADQRAGGDGDRRDPAEQRVGERALLALVAGGGERGDRRNDEHGAEALDARPADQQHRRDSGSARWSASRGRRSPSPIANARLRPRMSPSLAPSSMNAAITSVYSVIAVCTPWIVVLRSVHDLRDRDVHDARVEHHHELGRGQHGQGDPLANGRWRSYPSPLEPARGPAAIRSRRDFSAGRRDRATRDGGRMSQMSRKLRLPA